MIRKALLVGVMLALGASFATTAHASNRTYTATCAVGNFGNPPVNGFEVNGTGYTPGHTYYARVAQPNGAGTAQVLYQSSQGEFFLLDYNIVTPQELPDGTYAIKIWKSVDAYRDGNPSIAGCSAVAP